MALLILSTDSFGKLDFYKREDSSSIKKTFFERYINADCSVGEIVRNDTSKQRFINKITIYAGVYNYWSISNFERHNNSVFGSYYLGLTSNKKNIAFKIGGISEGESKKLNPNSKDGFASGTFYYVAFSKCLYFEKINYNLGLAGSYCYLAYYPNDAIEHGGAGILFDVSINITKVFSVNGFYINSLHLHNGLKVDNYFSVGIGINLYRR